MKRVKTDVVIVLPPRPSPAVYHMENDISTITCQKYKKILGPNSKIHISQFSKKGGEVHII